MKKTYTVYISTTQRKSDIGDTFNVYSFDLNEAQKDAECAISERYEVAYIEGYRAEVESEREYTSANELMHDLFQGDATSEDFNECEGSFTVLPVYYEDVAKAARLEAE